MNNKNKIITSLFLVIALSGCFGKDPAIKKVDSLIAKQAIDKTNPA